MSNSKIHPAGARGALVVGGGVAGMSCAISLKERGLPVTLIDRDEDWGVSGAGITITGPSLRAFKALGVLDGIINAGYVGEGIRVCDTQGAVLQELSTPMPAEAGVPGSGGITRPALHKVLADRMQRLEVPAKLGVTVASLTQDDDGVQVVFSDGNAAAYDLIVGADGVSSKIRTLIIPDAPKAAYTGQSSWRVTIDRPAVLDRRHYFLGGPHKVGLTPVSANEMYMFVLETAPKVYREDRELASALKALLKDYGGIVGEIRDGLSASSSIVFRPLEAFILPAPWHRGRVVLVGDAAHPTTPQLASGAGMAAEDGIVLGEALSHEADVAKALAAFSARREARCRLIVSSSMEIGRLEQLGAPVAEQTAVVEQALKKLMEPV